MSDIQPAEELRQLVHFMASNLVANPDEVDVTVDQRGQVVQLNLHVPESDMGKVIGKEGRIARSMRTIVTIASSRHNLHARLEIEG